MTGASFAPALIFFATTVYFALRARRYRQERDAADRHAQKLSRMMVREIANAAARKKSRGTVS